MRAGSPAGGLRVGVIGTGCIGLEHLRNLNLVKLATIAAICDSHGPSLHAGMETLEGMGIPAADVVCCSDYHELLALPQVDAVIVCTPNDHHREVLRAIAASGKHCLVEKPLCIDIAGCAEAEALAELSRAVAAAAGRPPPLFWCGMEYRYIPTIAKLIAEADAGVVGDLRMLSIVEHRFPFLRKVGDWNRFTARTGGTLTEKCCHFFDLMRRILAAEPVRIVATGGQAFNHKGSTYETHPGQQADMLDHAYVIVDFEDGRRAMLELCMFAEASKHQEQVSLVGTKGKLEAFAPSHGVRTDDLSLVNFRRGLRDVAFTDVANPPELVDPPPPSQLGSLSEEHVAADETLLEAGAHCGATHEELVRFTEAALRGGAEPEVSLDDGTKAVLMGLAAHRSIDTGRPVLWSEMLAELETAKASQQVALAPSAA